MAEKTLIIYEEDSWKDILEKIDKLAGLEKTEKVSARYEVWKCLKDNGFLRKEGNGSLRFVGTFGVQAEIHKIRVFSFPKYFRQKENPKPEQMRILRQVIERTGHLFDYLDEADFDANQYNKSTKKVGRYQLAKWLVNDYATNGVFSIREKRLISSSCGNIMWNRTILKTTSVIDGDDVAYIAPIRSYTFRNDNLLLSDIHRCAVQEAITDLGDEVVDILEPTYKEELLGHLEEFVSVIQSYQRTVYMERDILLLRYLEAWCLQESRYFTKPVGTVSFELVWEDVLRDVFGHKELNNKVGFGAPRYYIMDKEYELEGDSIPDGLNFWNDKDGLKFLVLDGKYYLGQLDGRKVKFLPGYKDVAKQIDYFDTLINVYKLNQEAGKNVFVLPWWNLCEEMECMEKKELCNGVQLRFVGYVRKPGAKDPIRSIINNLKRANQSFIEQEDAYEDIEAKSIVYLVQVEPDSLFYHFLKGGTIAGKNAIDIWNYLNDVKICMPVTHLSKGESL